MAKLLITGANGFIGSYIVEESIKRGHEVWAGVRASSNLKYIKNLNIQCIELHYNNPQALEQQLIEHQTKHGTWDYVIHNAGITKCDNKSDFETINYGYTVNLVNALIKMQMVPQKFIYMSSLSAWGSGDENSMAPIKLSDTPLPNTLYGKSKLKTEQYLKSLHHFNYVILRPTGVYGPREMDYFIMLKTIKRGLDPSMGTKPQYLTFIYVLDLVQVIFLALEKGKNGSAYFVSDTQIYTNSEYSALIKKALNKKKVFKFSVPLMLVKAISYSLDTIYGIFGKSPTLNKDKYRIISACNWKCETAPLVEDLGFVPQFPLKLGIQESVNWYQAEGWL